MSNRLRAPSIRPATGPPSGDTQLVWQPTTASAGRLPSHGLRGVDGAALSRVLDEFRDALDAWDLIELETRGAVQRIRNALARIAELAGASAETADHETAHAARSISEAARDLLIDIDACLADARAFDLARIFADALSPNGAAFDLDAIFTRPVRRSPDAC